MHKKLVVAGATLAVVIVASVLVGVLVNHHSEEDSCVVRIGHLNIVASLPFFVAEEKGFFEDEGVRYEAIPTATSNQLVDGIIAGNLDCFPESSAVPVLAVELQSPGRLKVFAVSEITPERPFDSLLVNGDSPINTLSDLAGKRIGVFPGSTATSLLRKHLTDEGVDVSGILFIPTPPPNQLAALLAGSVDAIHAYEPTTAIALSKGGVRKLYGSIYADMLSPNPQGVAVVGTKFLDEHPETAARTVRALERAMTYMKTNEAECRQILARRMKLSEDAATRCVFLYMLPHEEIDTDVFQRYTNMLTELRELDGSVSAANILFQP